MDTHKGTFFFFFREISYMIHEKQEVRKKCKKEKKKERNDRNVTCPDIHLIKLGYMLLGLPLLHKPGFSYIMLPLWKWEVRTQIDTTVAPRWDQMRRKLISSFRSAQRIWLIYLFVLFFGGDPAGALYVQLSLPSFQQKQIIDSVHVKYWSYSPWSL